MTLSPLDRMPQEQEAAHEDRGTQLAVVEPGGPLWDEASQMEAVTFMRREYVKTPEELAEEYAPYLSETSMIVATRGATGEVSGCVRAVEYNPEIGFKTIDDALNPDAPLEIDTTGWSALDKVDRGNIYEVGTISAKADAGAELYGAIIGLGLDKEPKRGYVVASLDETVLMRRIIPVFGDAVQILGPAKDYIGSPTVPVLIDLEKAWKNSQDTDQVHHAFSRIADGRQMVHGH